MREATIKELDVLYAAAISYDASKCIPELVIDGEVNIPSEVAIAYIKYLCLGDNTSLIKAILSWKGDVQKKPGSVDPEKEVLKENNEIHKTWHYMPKTSFEADRIEWSSLREDLLLLRNKDKNSMYVSIDLIHHLSKALKER